MGGIRHAICWLFADRASFITQCSSRLAHAQGSPSAPCELTASTFMMMMGSDGCLIDLPTSRTSATSSRQINVWTIFVDQAACLMV